MLSEEKNVEMQQINSLTYCLEVQDSILIGTPHIGV